MIHRRMASLFERLFDLLQQWFRHLLPWVILDDDQVGLVRRWGKFRRYLRVGWNWKWPVIEEPLATLGALETTPLREQTLTTLDGVPVTLRACVVYSVTEPRAYIIGCGNGETVVNDLVCCALAELVPQRSLVTVLSDPKFIRELTQRVKQRGKRWGITVSSVGVLDRVQCTTLRLIGGAPGVPT